MQENRMCPVCLTTAATAAAIAAGTGAAASLTALVLGKRRAARQALATPPNPQPEEK
jgi:hypothetical protein